MGNESKWATEMHIYAMAQVLRKDIIVHVDPPYGVGYEIFEFKPTEGSVSGCLKDALFLKHKSSLRMHPRSVVQVKFVQSGQSN